MSKRRLLLVDPPFHSPPHWGEIHGVKPCRICGRGHAKWHDLAQEPLNPVALIEWIEAMPVLDGLATKARIIGYVLGCTGIDHRAMRQALEDER